MDYITYWERLIFKLNQLQDQPPESQNCPRWNEKNMPAIRNGQLKYRSGLRWKLNLKKVAYNFHRFLPGLAQFGIDNDAVKMMLE